MITHLLSNLIFHHTLWFLGALTLIALVLTALVRGSMRMALAVLVLTVAYVLFT